MRLFLVVPATALFLSTVSPVLATNCSTVVACVLGQNASTGASSDIGVEGLSQHGFGLVGVTSASPSSSSGRVAGLYGKDQGATPYNSGVSAFSQNGTGLIGFGVNGDGVDGLSTAAAGATATNAVLGQDSGQNTGSDGVLGISTYGTGVAAVSVNGDAVETVAQGVNGLGLLASGGAQIQAVEIDTIGGGPLLAGFNTSVAGSAPLLFQVDAGGNEFLAGSLTTSSGTYARTRSTIGPDVASYGSRSASPTLEDFGQGSLREGYGHVALDATYASTIDTRSYLVFITPHGDSHSLYTTVLGSRGFDVHESELGRSSLAFDYRIVGRPLDMPAGHLPAVATLARFNSASKAHMTLAVPIPRIKKLAMRRG